MQYFLKYKNFYKQQEIRFEHINKGKVIQLQARCGPEGG